MKYTLDSPEMAFEAFAYERKIPEKIKIGKLLPLPNANRKTLSMFDNYTKEAWANPPKYCAFSDEPGSPIFKWKGKSIDSMRVRPVGVLTVSSRIPGEISSIGGSVLIIELHEKALK